MTTLKLLEDKIEVLAKKDSSIVLSRIESYDGIRNNLEKSRQALNQAGRADLEKLFVATLDKVEKDYKSLQTETSEKPILNEINSMQTGGMPLVYSINSLARLEEILESNQSANIEKAARFKRQRFEEYIGSLREFADNLLSRVEVVGDIGKAEELQNEIYQKQSRYESTPEAEKINNCLKSAKS